MRRGQEREGADKRGTFSRDVDARITRRVAVVRQQMALDEEMRQALTSISSAKTSQASVEVWLMQWVLDV